ncbi:hypothetical protein B0T20DRAFT_275142 [Sordaria brevicollis]|uniref:Tyrosinase copper-binding domain-containing protein n=1 Tax=Sordaria brevicollis TaxID=83679 RepID=A0AAE0PAY6_SORBR|nr:hypothetical protein B0T20DRAFT_275142 [Sordaria brevicollis]
MQIKSLICVSAALAGAASALDLPKFSQKDIDSGAALAALNKIATQNAMKNFKGKCKKSNYRVRQEWRTIPPGQRRKYIEAVKCFQKKPSVFPEIEGAVSAYEDLQWIHLNRTWEVHFSGLFLPWHRYLMHVYERELEACGYKGPTPYWEWGFDTEGDLGNSPVFDGSDTSIGSNGAHVPHEGYNITIWPDAPPVTYPPGNGGGCIAKGPFSDMDTHLGPMQLSDWGTSIPKSVEDPTRKNTRCVSRDLNNVFLKAHANFRNTTNLILLNQELDIFQAALANDARFYSDPRMAPFVGDQGVHFGGHMSIGGDPAGDFFLSNGDPAFYLHHGQVDRVWWIWQHLDPANRHNVSGTHTFLNVIPGPSPEVDLDEEMVVHPNMPPVVIRDLMNTLGGEPLCYVYI